MNILTFFETGGELESSLVHAALENALPEHAWGGPNDALCSIERDDYLDNCITIFCGGRPFIEVDVCIVFVPGMSSMPEWVRPLKAALARRLPKSQIIWIIDIASLNDRDGIHQYLTSAGGRVVNALHGRHWPTKASTMDEGFLDIAKKQSGDMKARERTCTNRFVDLVLDLKELLVEVPH